jgi:hypothetical protein
MAWARSSVAVGGKPDIRRRSAEQSISRAGLPHGGPDRPVDALNGESGLIVPPEVKSRRWVSVRHCGKFSINYVQILIRSLLQQEI